MDNGKVYRQRFIQSMSSLKRLLINSKDGSREQESRSLNRSMYLQIEEAEARNSMYVTENDMNYWDILEEPNDAQFQRLHQSGFASGQKRTLYAKA